MTIATYQYLEFARQLAAAAAAVTRSYFRQSPPISAKSDASPVTAADREAEQAMRALINRHYPAHGVIGEEHAREHSDAEFVWVLDPIDGTRSFIGGSPLFATLIALLRHGVPIVGVIDFPALGEQYCGIDSGEEQLAEFNGSACHCASAVPPLAQAVVAATTVGIYPGADDERMRRFLAHCGYARLGGDAFCYATLAGGWCHLALDHSMKVYDYMPLLPLVQAAGGVISDWQGQPLAPLTDAGEGRTVLAAANKTLHTEAVARLAAH